MPRSRPNPPILHMVVAIVIVLLPALLAVAWFTRIPAPAVTRVDPTPVLAGASGAPYARAVPTALPDGWVCTRARWTPVGQPDVSGAPAAGNTLGLGYLSPDGVYVAVDQRDASPDAFVAQIMRQGVVDGSSPVAGRSWRRYVSADGRTRALVLREPSDVTIVSGDVGYAALEAFAGTLTFRS